MCTNAVVAVVRIGCLFTQADRRPKRNTVIRFPESSIGDCRV